MTARTNTLPKLGVGCTGEARREATLDDRIGLAARVAADLLPEAGDSRRSRPERACDLGGAEGVFFQDIGITSLRT
jgi:hypothetical protein